MYKYSDIANIAIVAFIIGKFDLTLKYYIFECPSIFIEYRYTYSFRADVTMNNLLVI